MAATVRPAAARYRIRAAQSSSRTLDQALERGQGMTRPARRAISELLAEDVARAVPDRRIKACGHRSGHPAPLVRLPSPVGPCQAGIRQFLDIGSGIPTE